MVVLIAQSLDMRVLSFLKENAMHDAIVPLSLFLFGWMKNQLHSYYLIVEVSKANNYTKTTGKDFRKFNAFLFA
jgi:hypothetical protein